MKKITYSIAAFTLLLLVACSSNNQDTTAAAPPALPVATVAASIAETFNEYPATIEGEAEIEIRPQVGGILEKIYVDEGAYVSAGQPLFRIDDNVYREQLNNANAELLAAQAATASAQLEIDKIRPLVDNKVVAALQLKTAESNYAMAAARVQQAQARVTEAKINLGYTLIKAPAPGYIGLLNKKPGSLLSISDVKELTTLSNVNQVHVYFSMSEKEFSYLQQQLPGTTIEKKFKQAKPVSLALAGNEIYPEPGRLDMVNGAFDKNAGAITIRASFHNLHGLLRSGNTGKIKLAFVQDNVITIPQAATTGLQDKLFVFAVDDSNKVHKQAITVSGRSGNSFLVRDGLKDGDKIVLEGIETLQDGMKIQYVKPVAVARANQ